jgi:hypothetical protein
MRVFISAALAFAAASSLNAQTATPAAPPLDLSTANPVEGNWVYSTNEATFRNSSALPQLTIRCTVATRQVTISKPAAAAAASLDIWTSSATRSLGATYNPATASLSATLSAYDPFLDAIAFSRGRFGVSIPGQPALVVPSWAEVSRVFEDCRA